VPFVFLPGSFGGVLTNMSLAGNNVYVATLNLPLEFTNVSQVDGSAPNDVKTGGDIDALNVTTGKVEWDTKVAQLPLGATTVVNNLIFTTLYDGELLALNRSNGAIVYRAKIPDSTNAAIAVAGDTIVVPAGGPQTKTNAKVIPQIVAYRLS
jgi:alcohol dehydrogenase (cytochrome c)